MEKASRRRRRGGGLSESGRVKSRFFHRRSPSRLSLNHDYREMNSTVAAVLTTALFATNLAVERPKTVNEAVQILKTKWLQPSDRDWILRNTKEEVWGRLYMGFGTGVRNEFGLRGDNQPLHDSCGTKDPEGCSSVILNRLWESVRGDADPALVHQLDCQFQLYSGDSRQPQRISPVDDSGNDPETPITNRLATTDPCGVRRTKLSDIVDTGSGWQAGYGLLRCISA